MALPLLCFPDLVPKKQGKGLTGQQVGLLQGQQRGCIFNEAGDHQCAVRFCTLCTHMGMAGSPWNKSLCSLPAPRREGEWKYSVLFLITHCWSRCESKGNAKLSSLFLVITPSALLPPLTQLQPVPPSCLWVLCAPGHSCSWGSSAVRGSPLLPSSHTGDAERSVLSCRRQPCQADHLGRRAPGAGTGVLAWPHPCQAEQPRHTKVGMVWGMGWAVPVPKLHAWICKVTLPRMLTAPEPCGYLGPGSTGALVGHCPGCV